MTGTSIISILKKFPQDTPACWIVSTNVPQGNSDRLGLWVVLERLDHFSYDNI
jgi:hypothetical protein